MARAETGDVPAGPRSEEELEELRRRVGELEEELEEARRLALVGATMRGLAHSIRSTLGLCRAATYMVDRAIQKWDRPELERAWGMVERSHSRITSMVSRLLDPEQAGRLSPRAADPNAVVREVGEVAAEEAADQGDELLLELADDLEGVAFDRQAFHRCCVELISNSLDALVETPDEGRITVRTARVADGWTLSVADTGPGMTEEQLRLALRGGYSSKGKGGTGLGLAQVRALVRQHGGELAVTTEPGKGTEVRCRFPLAPPPSEDPDETSDEEQEDEERR